MKLKWSSKEFISIVIQFQPSLQAIRLLDFFNEGKIQLKTCKLFVLLLGLQFVFLFNIIGIRVDEFNLGVTEITKDLR